MRNWLTVAALAVFAVSTGLLALVQGANPPTADLPPAMAEFNTDTPPLDATVTSGIGR